MHSVDRNLATLSTLGLTELRDVLRRLGRTEANSDSMDILLGKLKQTMEQDVDYKMLHVVEVLEFIAALEHVDTARIRALFLDGDIPLAGCPVFQSKPAITGASRAALVAKVQDILIFSGHEVLESLSSALHTKQVGISIGSNVMSTIDHVTWTRGTVQSLEPLCVRHDGSQDNVEVEEVCLEETYYAAEIKNAFKAADTNGDGVLSCEELSRVMRALGFVKSNDEMAALFEAVDSDASGEVDYNEFVDWVMGGCQDTRCLLDDADSWISGIDAPPAEGDSHVNMHFYHGGYDMHGPGVVVIGKSEASTASVAGEFECIAISNQCMEGESSAVSGVSFDVHGVDFQIGLVTMKHRHCGLAGLDLGVMFAEERTPYDCKYHIKITEDGKVFPASFGQFKRNGFSRIAVAADPSGKFEFRHNGQKFYTSRRSPKFPVFVKIFAASSGPLLQDLKWIARSCPAGL